tara:strand:- start:38 stop:388 length:351 start_codon:yes stop_codon:yes gene_type:complete
MQKGFPYINIILISLGAIPAALLRWRIEEIFLINIIGCFLFGYVNSSSISKKFKLILGFGFCGSFTTFSGWILRLFKLVSDGYYIEFFVRSTTLIASSLLAVYLGKLIATKIQKLT